MISNRRRQILQFAIDAGMLVLSYCLTWILTFFLDYNGVNHPIGYSAVFTAVNILYLFLFGCNKSHWKYTSTADAIKLIFAVSATVVSLLTFRLVHEVVTDTKIIFNSYIILYGMISISLLMLVRFHNRIFKTVKYSLTSNKFIKDASNLKRTLIYGAGYTGRQVAERFITFEDGYLPVGFVDDSSEKKDTTISGIRIFGGREILKELTTRLKIDVIVIAIQNISKKNLKEIFQACAATGVAVKITPNIDSGEKIISGSSLRLRDIKMEELLGRESFEVKIDLLNHFIKDKVILVTGGAGSIGSELCRQVLNYQCKKLIALDWHENSLFLLDQELSKKYDNEKFEIVVASIRDKARLKSVFDKYKPEVVFHAAAYKHVPVMEHSAVEAIKNNVFGTKNVIEQCEQSKVKKFILISSDKAVNPANIMGATKRIAEMLIQTQSKHSETQMAAVRFGNVLGSNGSVVGIFLDQIRNGGPITLTHKDIKRYFMTIPEACKLVLQAGALATSGEVFVLDMGEPMFIYDLAVDLIKMNGLQVGKDIEIVVSGLRPGEKLFEELKFDGESCDKTLHSGIFACKLEDVNEKDFALQMEKLNIAMQNEDSQSMENNIFELVPTAYREKKN